MESKGDSGVSSNGESSNSSCDSGLVINDIITEKMALEEAKLEEKIIEEEKRLKEKMLKEEKSLKEEMVKEEKKRLEEQCYKRLHLLLSRSSIYAQFMADKLKRDDLKNTKKQLRLEKQKNAENSNKNSRKRKSGEDNPPKKKLKGGITVVDAFKNENQNYEEQNDENKGLLNCLAVEENNDLKDKQPSLLTGGVMHPYQLEGYEWLTVLYENGVNGILADEMGLGKTIQSIAFICHLIEMGICGPFLVVGPLLTVPNWYSEIKRFSPSVPAIIYHGSKEDRNLLRKKISMKVQTNGINCYPVVITSYQIALNDAKLLGKYNWKLLIIDEAHRIKNFECKLITALKRIPVSHRLLLTGTPLQNNLSELWSLLNFILPEIFDDLKVFESWFDVSRIAQKEGSDDIVAKEQEKQIVSIIHEILTPFLLRRTKAEVQLNLPQKKEVIVYAPFTELQQEYYTAALNKTIQDSLNVGKEKEKEVDINSGRPKRHRNTENFNYDKYFEMYKEDDEENIDNNKENMEDDRQLSSVLPVASNADKKNIFAEINIGFRNISMMLRKICLHPYLISYPLEDSGSYKVDEDLIKSSGKLLVLDLLLPELKKRGHKILVFSQFVLMLEILEDYCKYRNYSYNFMSGIMSLEDRENEIKEFNESPDSFLFLISTRAGGLGINLAHADTVIIFDSDWNPQSDLQAQDRCHRIGQTKPVVVYRFIVPNTVDEHIFNRATAKRKLEKVIIKEGRFNSNRKDEGGKLSVEELLKLLKSCESNECVKADCKQVLSPAELERLLDRSDIM